MRFFQFQKIIEGSIFRGLHTTNKLLSNLRPFEATTSIRPPRPSEAKNRKKIVILPSLKESHSFILQGPHLRPLEPRPRSDLRCCSRPLHQSIPLRPFEARPYNTPIYHVRPYKKHARWYDSSLLHSKFQSWQMCSLPTLDPYVC